MANQGFIGRYVSGSKRFIFHAEAFGAAVNIHRSGGRELNLSLPIHGQSVLPWIGGVSKQSVLGSPLRLVDFVQYFACETSAEGHQAGDTASTELHASVSHVRVMNKPSPGEREGVDGVEFQADKIRIGMRSEYHIDREPTFHLLEATRDGMWIDLHRGGKTERVPLKLEFHVEPGKSNDLAFPQANARNCRPDRYLLGSIVSGFTRGSEHYQGHILREPGLGTIFFGEIVMAPDSRRLSMVRIELGSDSGGDAQFGGIGSNGPWHTP